MKIHEHAAQGNTEGVRAELRHGVPVDVRDEGDFTPLAQAVESPLADESTLRVLIEAGADVNALVENGKDFPLSLATGTGDLSKLALLLTAGANVNQVNKSGYSALLSAMYRLGGSEQLVPVAKLLIESGANIEQTSSYGELPLKVASMRDRFDAVGTLLDAGADPRALQWTELMRAVALGSLEDVQAQLALNRSLEHCDHFDRTPFLLATAAGDIQKADLLLQHGANLEDEIRGGGNALTHAAEKADAVTLKWLIDAGAKLDAGNSLGYSPLMLAAQCGSAPCVELLLRAGANLNHKNEFGDTAICEASSEDVVRLLVAAGADIDGANSETRRKLVGLTGEGPLNVDESQYRSQRSPRFGRSNPEPMQMPFWEEMVRAGISAYWARKQFGDTECFDGPVWCFNRCGTSFTALPGGRVVQIGGEHEDFYDPDFCIYNDVIVHEGPGQFRIFGYPEATFPPTDFHSATYVDGYLYIIGRLGYQGCRQFGMTPVYRLNCSNWSIELVSTRGENPGWIYKHVARASGSNCIAIAGGRVARETAEGEQHLDNEEEFTLDLSDGTWRRR